MHRMFRAQRSRGSAGWLRDIFDFDSIGIKQANYGLVKAAWILQWTIVADVWYHNDFRARDQMS